MRNHMQRYCLLPALLSVIALGISAGCGGSGEPSATNAPSPAGSPESLATGGGSGQAADGVQTVSTPMQLNSPQGLSGPQLGMPASGAGAMPSAEPVVAIETSLGTITVKLLPDRAPITVQNFLSYVQSGFYNGTIFHQVFSGAVILGGQYTPDYQPRQPGPPIFNEAHNGLKNVRGTLAMAREYNITDSATCQFFINVKDNPNYDHREATAGQAAPPEQYGYCVFGEVASGMDVVDRIAGVQVHDTQGFERTPVEPVVIRSVRRVQ